MGHDLRILILAAGSSSRMRGADKLLEPVAGEPLLRAIARHALATGLPVAVVLPPDRPQRAAALTGLPLQVVIAERAAQGMAESLKAGVAALPPQAAVLLLLADLPEITTADLTALIAAHASTPEAILRGTSASGQPGHPVLFPPDLRPALLSITGDEGARKVLSQNAARVRGITLPENHAVTDLDTPEDWSRWRASLGQ